MPVYSLLLRTLLYIAFCWVTGFLPLVSQTQLFTGNSKWGIRDEAGKALVEPLYDTIFNFDPLEKVCLACFEVKVPSNNKFIKALTTVYSCNYLNGAGKRLFIKADGNDTCSVFTLTKSMVRHYNTAHPFFSVSVKGRKHLVSRDFKQLTFKGYSEISLSPDPNYYIVQEQTDYGATLVRLIDLNEEQVIPFDYSSIRINPYDSLIICCSAGLRPNGSDDVFNYNGKKIDSYHRHVELATKHFIVHKLYEPKEYYIIYNISTKEEQNLSADEVLPSVHDEILIRLKNDWYLYDLNTHQKKPFKSS